MKAIYFDHAATTPVHPAVMEAMYPYYIEDFGNPSSIHGYGRKAQQAISQAREEIAKYLHVSPFDIIFTSGGTESNHLAIHSSIDHARKTVMRPHVITTSIEHHAVLKPIQKWEKQGVDVTYLPVNSFGLLDISILEQAITPQTVLISVMYGNNEVGTIQPIQAISELTQARGICFHVDAVQALGKIHIDLQVTPVDFMSFSAHKLNGPKGVGALYVSPKRQFIPLFLGGSQEKKRRAGTENVAGIVGFAKAIELASANIEIQTQKWLNLRQAMIRGLQQKLTPEEFVLNSHLSSALPHILNISFPHVPTEVMLMNLDLAGFAVSSGSACTSGSLEVSHVLQAMHLPETQLQSAIRFSFGYGHTLEDVHLLVNHIEKIVHRIRNVR